MRQLKMAQDRLARLLKQQEMKRTSATQSMEKIKMEREVFEEEQSKAQVCACARCSRTQTGRGGLAFFFQQMFSSRPRAVSLFILE